ncbi:hypothetical protein, partial [Klebsiella pneumoniae]|uniref:hypothetical protein n=1 Tax=Klebsiella pneumoniae TaxID=573 RepID=UPI003CECCB54
LMMSLWDALRMNMMISYQELVRTFPNFSLATAAPETIKRLSAIKIRISLSPSVNDAAIVAEVDGYDKTCSSAT